MKLLALVIFVFLSAAVHCQSAEENKTPSQCVPGRVSRSPRKKHCKAIISSYRYDIESELCVLYKRGGCGYGSSDYKKLKDCVTACGAKNNMTLPDFCHLAPDGGNCDEELTRFYFDSDGEECKEFSYGGCGGNDNRFEGSFECRRACTVV